MTSKEETALIDDIMEEATEKLYSPNLVHELSAINVTDYQRGKIAGQIEMYKWFLDKFNPEPKEEVKDEDYLAGQTLD